MSLKIVIILASLAGLVGLTLGYYLRLIISLGKRGSMELEIKQMELAAKEEAKKIVLEAEHKAAETMKELRTEAREREEKIKTSEDRLIKKEDMLDKRQVDLDNELESLKKKINDIKEIKERADKLLVERERSLEKVAGMSLSSAKEELLRSVEKKYEEDLLIRMQKLETAQHEKIESRAKDIIATAIQRLGNSVAADIFSTTIPITSVESKKKT
ncbi:MAG TPA: Rnase Y domain-containing protein, partial [Candidatus Paceibacterota bacterium]|nr:Rnase Y domain-containing protein [Candidatus Paceibacterota bacterium]